MSIRIALLTLIVLGLAIYAWRDWYFALCGLVLLMAVIEHPDMPKNIAGIQGLNPWNVLMASILLAWCAQRRGEGLVWDMPRHVTVMLLLYLAVILVGVVRMIVDRSYLEDYGRGELISEYLINCVKWVIPGLLLFDGCRTHKRLTMAVACLLGVYLLLAVQVIRWMPPSAAVSVSTLMSCRKAILNEIGYSQVNMSMLLSGGAWAIVSVLVLIKRRWAKVLVVTAVLATSYGQALTGGRMGYVTWGIVGLVLCSLRWRKGLLVAPIVPIAVVLFMPGVVDRMTQGFGSRNAGGESYTDDYEVTAGRTLIWPYVIDKITESPVIGHGRLAMTRTGLTETLGAQFGESEAFPHPHNAYLEWLLDNGIVGLALIAPFYAIVLWHAVSLFLDRSHPWFTVVGGATCALIMALLIASMGSQTFYPREGAVGMWVAIGLTLRMSLVRAQVRAGSPAAAPRRVVEATVRPAWAAESYH